MPAEVRAKPKRSYEALKTSISTLNKTLGCYPPKIESDEQRQAVYQNWSDALSDVRSFQDREGETERVLWMLSELYRQGHNLDVEGSGGLALQANEYCLTQFPQSVSCHFSAVYLYLAVAPTPANLARAQTSLSFLRRKFTNKPNEDVEEAIIYLYAYQQRPDAAIKQIDRFLKLYPWTPKKPTLQKLKQALQEGEEIYPGPEFPGPSGARK